MNSKFLLPLFSLVICLSILGCKVNWVQAINYGRVVHTDKVDSVEMYTQNNLIFIPVRINGKTYRFLFDSGALLSVSQEIQNEINGKVISKAHIVDSDRNRKKVSLIQIDSISIGSTIFLEQTAFIGDFKANPILKCLDFDGIIGSNFMRDCNWNINPKNQLIRVSQHSFKTVSSVIIIPFSTNQQYDMFIPVKVGNTVIENVLVDYGSNGGLQLRAHDFNRLKSAQKFDTTYVESGFQNAGIIGTPVAINREFTLSDSVIFGFDTLQNIRVKSGTKNSIGNQILSQYEVSIDWSHRHLALIPLNSELPKKNSAGFKLGYNPTNGVHVQSILSGSTADINGLKPLMKVITLDSLNFEKTTSFCEYVSHSYADSVTIQCISTEGDSLWFTLPTFTL